MLSGKVSGLKEYLMGGLDPRIVMGPVLIECWRQSVLEPKHQTEPRPAYDGNSDEYTGVYRKQNRCGRISSQQECTDASEKGTDKGTSHNTKNKNVS